LLVVLDVRLTTLHRMIRLRQFGTVGIQKHPYKSRAHPNNSFPNGGEKTTKTRAATRLHIQGTYGASFLFCSLSTRRYHFRLHLDLEKNQKQNIIGLATQWVQQAFTGHDAAGKVEDQGSMQGQDPNNGAVSDPVMPAPQRPWPSVSVNRTPIGSTTSSETNRNI
jgi:hypothetical protein